MEVLKNISSCLASFTKSFENFVPLHLRISPKAPVQCGWRRVLMHDSSTMTMHLYFKCLRVIVSCIMSYALFLLQCFLHSMFLLMLFVLLVALFVDLTLLCFVLSELKSKKLIKSKKISKSLLACIVSYHMLSLA